MYGSQQAMCRVWINSIKILWKMKTFHQPLPFFSTWNIASNILNFFFSLHCSLAQIKFLCCVYFWRLHIFTTGEKKSPGGKINEVYFKPSLELGLIPNQSWLATKSYVSSQNVSSKIKPHLFLHMETWIFAKYQA